MKNFLCLLALISTSVLAKSPRIIELNEKTTISFNNKFSGSYVAKKQMEAITKCAASPSSEITIVFYSPGGSVSAGQLLFDTLNALPCKFNTLTIFGASMAYQAVQNLGKRLILPSGVLMSHRAYVSGLSGEIGGELDSIISLLKGNIENLDKIAANRIGISLKEYQNLVRDELWLTSSQAVENNHADEVVLARCGESLSGTYTQTFSTFFGVFDVEFSECPLAVSPVSVKSVNGEENPDKFFNYFNNITDRVTLEK